MLFKGIWTGFGLNQFKADKKLECSWENIKFSLFTREKSRCITKKITPTLPSLFLNIHHPSVSPLPSPQQQNWQYKDYGLSMQVNVYICTYGIKMNNWQNRLPRHTKTFTDANTRRNMSVCQASGECWPQHQDELGVGDWRWGFKFWSLGMYPLPCWYLFPLNLYWSCQV